MTSDKYMFKCAMKLRIIIGNVIEMKTEQKLGQCYKLRKVNESEYKQV